MIGGVFCEWPLWAVLLAQATACVAAGLTGSYLLGRQAARGHSVLLIGLLLSVLMPASYLLVKHYNLGVLVPEERLFATEGTEGTENKMGGVSLGEVATDDVDTLDATMVDESWMTNNESQTTAVGWIAFLFSVFSLPWKSLGFLAWAAATTVLLGRLVMQFMLGVRLVNDTQTVEASHVRQALEEAKTQVGLTGPVELRCSGKIRSPIIWCWRRVPVLLVQKHAGKESKICDWVGVFCHELAHCRRLDHVGGLLAELLVAAMPWHPLLWWARTRLLVLSEEACDDWVLAAGRIGVDYAESLLDLTPQGQTAFLPTVVGKEKLMKERIRRIVKNGCGNPQMGKGWALAVGILALGATVGVALAQTRPEGDQPRPAPEAKALRDQGPQSAPKGKLAAVGRRNVLNRVLNQLREQATRTENALKERGAAQDEPTQILRAELVALQNQIQTMERQLQNVDRPQRPRAEAAQTPAKEPAAQQRLNALREKAQQTRRRLAEIDPGSEEAKGLNSGLAQVQEQIRVLEERLQNAENREKPAAANRGAARVPQQRPAVERPKAPAGETIAPERLAQIKANIAQGERKLGQLENEGQGNSDAANQLRKSLETMRQRLRAADANAPTAITTRRDVQVERSAVTRPRAEAGQQIDGRPAPVVPAAPKRPAADGNIQAQVEQLRTQMNGLNRQMQKMQELLEQLAAKKTN